jgi:hypothetical protein
MQATQRFKVLKMVPPQTCSCAVGFRNPCFKKIAQVNDVVWLMLVACACLADICRKGHSSATTSTVQEPRISHLSSSYGRHLDLYCDSDRCSNRDSALSNLFYFAGKHKLAAQQFFLVRKNYRKGITESKLLCRPAEYSTISVGKHMLRRCEICCVSLNKFFFSGWQIS